MSRPMEDLSSFPSTASTSQEDHESNSESTSSRKLRVTLLSSEWRSTKGGLSTINRELAIQLAKHPIVEVSVYLPQCSEEDKQLARDHNVRLIKAREMPGLEPNFWLSCLPEGHAVDCVIGHGAVLGRQVQIIKRHHHCKWIQVVHTSPEELGMYKEYEEHIFRGEEKHQVEVELCKLADQVVAVGPKLADAFSGYLRPCGKDKDVLNLTPGIFSEFVDVNQSNEERNSFNVLVFGRGDSEDFQIKGYDIAAQAIAELKDTTYKLVFVGATRGEEDNVAKTLVQQGIAPSQLRVRRFNESRRKLADLFCEVDLAIMPSRTEGFGLAALEALSAGLPVLVSGNSGLAEALKKVPHGASCVVTSDDPKDWASAIRAVRHKDREMRLGEFDFVRGAYAKKYSWKEQCDKLVERMKVISSEDSSKRLQSLDKGKRPLSPSETPASKQPRLFRYAGCSGDEQDLSVKATAVCSVYEKAILVNKPLHKDTKNLGVLKMLRAEYERRAKLKPLSWLNTMQLPLKNVYTRLKIISRRKADFQVENEELGMYDIFQALGESEDVKMTLAEGSPGTGKTTFCLKLAYDWARGEMPTNCSFPKFEFVLLLKCRDINGDLMEAIKEQLLPEDIKEETWTKLSDFITDIDNQERILIILDGLDELQKSHDHVFINFSTEEFYHFVLSWLHPGRKQELKYVKTANLIFFWRTKDLQTKMPFSTSGSILKTSVRSIHRKEKV
ncbi:unnamed protein product [Porites lobata]|uniref:NACHT domain-containing protein n=1 Tax=Porites lobata TaxID=104759 RepID=A0ABN8S5N0_9CNID|nr:unnamed protein product [Porites lobata]